MSSKRILRSVLVAVVAVGLAVGSAAAAAPDRGEGVRAAWGVSVGEWVEVIWGWVAGGQDEAANGNTDSQPTDERDEDDSSCDDCADGGPELDPNG
jgi:hypothetical protein